MYLYRETFLNASNDIFEIERDYDFITGFCCLHKIA